MGSTFYSVDIVNVRINLLAVTRIVLQCDVDGDDLVRIHAHGFRNEFLGTCIKIVDELAESLFGIEEGRAVNLLAGGFAFAGLVGNEFVHQGALVGEADLDSLVQESELAETCRQGIIFINDGLGENGSIRMEGDYGSVIRFRALPYDFHLGDGLAFGILLLENLALAVNLRYEQVGQCVDAGHAHAVKTSGNLVAVLAEFTSGMENGKNDFKG